LIIFKLLPPLPKHVEIICQLSREVCTQCWPDIDIFFFIAYHIKVYFFKMRRLIYLGGLFVLLLLSLVLLLRSKTIIDEKTSSHDPLSISDVKYWAYQIQDLDSPGAIDLIVNSSYDMVVIDPMVTHDYSFDASSMVSRIKASYASDGFHRKLVLAYIDIGQAEEWRWYWDGHTTYEEEGECKYSFIKSIKKWAPWVVACDPDGWAGNYPVAFWNDSWKDIVIYGTALGSHLGLYFNSMLDEVIKDGFDGIYLDWVEAWEMDEVRARAHNEGKDPGQEMLTFIEEMRSYGRQFNPNFIVIQQNSSELIREVGANVLKNAVDGIAQEGVWWDGDAIDDDWHNSDGFDQPSCCTAYYLSRLREYKAAGFPVFVCDYAVKHADEVYRKATEEGFIAYASRRPLNRLTTTPPVFQIEPGPEISLSKNGFYFGSQLNGKKTGQQSFLISNSGKGVLNWAITDNAAWLACEPLSGTNSANIRISVDNSGLSPGLYSGIISVSDPKAINSPAKVTVSLVVYGNNGTAPPFGIFATPDEGATVRGSVAVTGWVLDDIEVAKVKVYRKGTYSSIYIGDAVFVDGARPDIEQSYPDYPFNYRAGWGYMMLTNFLPNGGNGTFYISAKAVDVEGQVTTLGTKTIFCDNANAVKPFGAIDTPTQGGVASGKSFINWGWVLTPQPNKIPFDGSTINVTIDGINLGHPHYNLNRKDIELSFPGYANSKGAVGYFILDTTKFSNGVHTIQWTATDSAGNTDGIGSRYFTILNADSTSDLNSSPLKVNGKEE
jgi:uncharacterized protein (TIGR01370 family)